MSKINRKFIIIIAFLIAVLIAGVFAFYKYGKSFEPEATLSDRDNSFIQDIVKAPGVEGNIVNSGIAGIVVLADGRPFAAMLDIFKSGDMSKPFISVIAKEDGTIQIPLKPDSYVIKPLDPDGPRAPTRENYAVNVGSGQWVHIKIEYR